MVKAVAAVEVPVESIVFRQDRQDGWHRRVVDGVEVSFALAFPDVCPPTLAVLSAGVIRDGMLYPAGSVAHHFASIQAKHRQAVVVPDVYFIQSARGVPIKIGMARDIGKRLEALQTAHPHRLLVLGVIPRGGRLVERQLHERFAAQRLLGEWFECSKELMEAIP